ncbi:MAG: leucyl aminopeptidase family protein, partial [Hyphomicrobiales bacterium]
MRETLIHKSEAQASTPIIAVTEASLVDVLSELGDAAASWCNANGYSGKASSFQLVPGLSGG